ncbi:ribosome hibernation-promoting factor, HPF/YfiA family [Deferrisoma camini]|uniref:ribosome hibernation-promoting factor, HPF/YfiA family n=1 Tax=Deferrisoma camini TaxID=1035120 RepID=UPI00046D89B9|nr:ribosome-associated translation inhibitor RaiA [Deferrisoma camini]
MNLNITFRHAEPSDALKQYATEKVQRLHKYFDGIVDGHVVLTAEKIRHLAEVTLHANGTRIHAKEESTDFYSAVDNVVDKLERQLKRYKEKLKRHKPIRAREARAIQEQVLAFVPAEGEEEGEEPTSPRVIQTEHYTSQPLSVEDAVMEMDLTDRAFLVFTDEDGQVKVLYRRDDGNYGLIEPA